MARDSRGRMFMWEMPVYLASISRSTNLVQWQVVATNSADTNGFPRITDTNALGRSMMFYRLSWP